MFPYKQFIMYSLLFTFIVVSWSYKQPHLTQLNCDMLKL